MPKLDTEHVAFSPVITDTVNHVPNDQVPDFVASGASHANGGVPDPGAGAGAIKVLREDASWTKAPVLTGNTVWVDAVDGIDATGTRGRQELPFLTIQAAINAAVAGDVVVVRPGTYTGVLVCKDNVSVQGLDNRDCILNSASAVAVTVVTLAENMHFSNFRMTLSPSANLTTGILMAGTSNATSMVFRVRQVASPTGTGTVRGLLLSGTGVSTSEHRTAELCVFMGAEAAQFAVDITGAGTSSFRACLISGGAGTGLRVGAGATVLSTLNRMLGTTRGIDVVATGVLTIDGGTTYDDLRNLGTLNRDLNVYARNNFAAVIGPTTTDDQTKGYAAGSFWLDTVVKTLYTCATATTGAAFWSFVQSANNNTGSDRPNEFFLGDLLSYAGSANVTASEIQYARCWLTAGAVLKKMVLFQDSGGSGARSVRMGVYSQTTPASSTGLPVTRVAQTNTTATSGANNGTFVPISLTADYTVTVSGYYWLAIITDSTSLAFASTAVARTNLWPVRRESGATTVLPATAGTLSNPTSALIYCAASEV